MKARLNYQRASRKQGIILAPSPQRLSKVAAKASVTRSSVIQARIGWAYKL
jgi:hypothetical protein